MNKYCCLIKHLCILASCTFKGFMKFGNAYNQNKHNLNYHTIVHCTSVTSPELKNFQKLINFVVLKIISNCFKKGFHWISLMLINTSICYQWKRVFISIKQVQIIYILEAIVSQGGGQYLNIQFAIEYHCHFI